MDWKALFKAQKELDKHILQEKGLEGQDLLDMKKLALQVEVGELANEWRGFKFWSENQVPQKVLHTTLGANEHNAVYFKCSNEDSCGGYLVHDDFKNIFDEPNYDDCPKCEEGSVFNFRVRNPILEEFVDCLHFILSIGNHIGVKSFEPIKLISLTNDITGQFNAVFKLIGKWEKLFLFLDRDSYHVVVNEFLKLGEMLGFTEKQIEQAYWDKNAINHKRQESNY